MILSNPILIGRALAATEEELGSAKNVGEFVSILFKWGVPVATSLAVAVMIYAGYLYMTSQGNPDTIKSAKDYIIGALVGLALIILAGVILKNVIGVNY